MCETEKPKSLGNSERSFSIKVPLPTPEGPATTTALGPTTMLRGFGGGERISAHFLRYSDAAETAEGSVQFKMKTAVSRYKALKEKT